MEEACRPNSLAVLDRPDCQGWIRLESRAGAPAFEDAAPLSRSPAPLPRKPPASQLPDFPSEHTVNGTGGSPNPRTSATSPNLGCLDQPRPRGKGPPGTLGDTPKARPAAVAHLPAARVHDEECKKKWRNARDRCMKIRQKLDAARRSGCVGKDVRKPYWCHYSLLDSMLEDTTQCSPAYSEEVPETEEQPCKFDGGHSREDAEVGETFNGNACHRHQPRARAAPRRKGPTVDPSPRGKRRSCEPPDTDPLARSVKDALERCSAALSGLPDRPGHERDDYCDIEATWIASKLKIFPRSHRCRVAHKIHCIIHEEEMKLYE
ncbi:hypothetical protein HPB47_010435 [Ixodes persulcatus]|uniref:Uncharacterized protein n=1 Tax=Ixodes persulcatus TaxID=34615 RepID=A0AC60NZR8_IXOPE|nr:hypothetical protein HPB47_010435 [Ixodes persulcatus]